MKYDRRKAKRKMNRLAKKIFVGGYFLGCNGHPCKCTNKNVWYGDIWGSDVDGDSIIDGSGMSCSMLHCSPEPLSKQEAELIKENYIRKPRYHISRKKLY